MIPRILLVLALGASTSTSSAFAGDAAPPPAAQEPAATVFLAAAASLRRVFTDRLLPGFRELRPDIEVVATYDASGKLQRQIENGLDADVFMSAGAAQMNALTARGLVAPDSVRDVVENRMVLIRAKGSSAPKVDFSTAPGSGVLALGDPGSVPAGRYAKEIFTRLGVWDKARKGASFGANVTEVLSWVAEGAADLGVVYATDAAASEKVEVLREAPEGSMEKKPVYPVGRIAKSPRRAEADALVAYIASEEAAAAFRSHGFTPIRPGQP